MKSTVLFARMLGLIMLAGCVKTTSAQITNTNFKTRSETKRYVVPDLDSLAGRNNARLRAGNNISVKAVRNFMHTYKLVSNENWYKIEDGYLAEFIADDIKTTVMYDVRGIWRYTIRRYHENKLPTEVRKIVKSVYFDYSIRLVEEIVLYDKVIYLVNVEDATTWKKLRVCDYEMEPIEEYNKLTK